MAYSDTVLADSPWAYYKLDDAGGTTMADSSGNARPMTLNAAAGGYAQPALLATLGPCLLNSGQAYGTLPNGLTGGDLTFEMWWKPTVLNGINDLLGVDGETRIIRSGDSGQPAGRLQVNLSGAAIQTAPSDTNVVGVLHHLAFRYTASTGRVDVFVDGAPYWNFTTTANAFTGTVVRWLWGGIAGRQARGYFSHVAFYKAALSDAKILAHVQAATDVTGVSITGLTGYGVNQGLVARWAPVLGASGYEYRINGGATQTAVTTSYVVVTGLTVGTPVLFEVRPTATNGSRGNWVSVNVTPNTSFILDLFARADVTPVSGGLGSPTFGPAWIQGGGVAGISVSQAYATAAENHMVVAGAYDIDMTATFAVLGLSGGLIFRWRDVNNTWLIQSDAAGWTLYRRVSGTWNTLFRNTSTLPSPSQVLRVITLGRQIFVLIDGRIIINLEDDYGVSATDTSLGMHLGDATTRVSTFTANITNVALPGRQNGPSALADASVVSVPGASPNGHVYKGRDLKSLDSVGAS